MEEEFQERDYWISQTIKVPIKIVDQQWKYRAHPYRQTTVQGIRCPHCANTHLVQADNGRFRKYIPVARSCSCFGNMVCAKDRLKLSTIVANGRLKFMAQLANGHGGLKLRTIVAKAKLKFRTNKANGGLKFLAQMAKPLDLGTVARRMVLMLRSQQ